MCNDISSQKFIVVLYSSGKNFTNLASEIGSIVMVQGKFGTNNEQTVVVSRKFLVFNFLYLASIIIANLYNANISNIAMQ